MKNPYNFLEHEYFRRVLENPSNVNFEDIKKVCDLAEYLCLLYEAETVNFKHDVTDFMVISVTFLRTGYLISKMYKYQGDEIFDVILNLANFILEFDIDRSEFGISVSHADGIIFSEKSYVFIADVYDLEIDFETSKNKTSLSF
jgi:hypothetical protein